jgi:hypothetical protein
MLLLPFIEERLGAIALWPTYVLRILFVDGPTLLGVSSVAAFFYGNGIPMNAAISLYLTCSGYNVSFKTHIIQTCYDEWNETSGRPVNVIYFNTEERLYRFVHGPVLPVLKEFSPMGFDSYVRRTPAVEVKIAAAQRGPYIPQAFYCVLQPGNSSARRKLFTD